MNRLVVHRAPADPVALGLQLARLPGRDTGELLNLLADWAPEEADRRQILASSPDRLFFSG